MRSLRLLIQAYQGIMSFTGNDFQIKSLDIFSKRSILRLIPTQFSHPVDFQRNLSLSGTAMKMRLPKVLKVKPLRDFSSLPEAFSFWR
jgi:hypothetical protein